MLDLHPGLTFDEDAHRYTLHGRELMSVTTALKLAGLIDDRWYYDQAATRGTYVHQALEWLDRGELDETSIDPQLAGYIQAYRRFLLDCHAGPLHLYEQRLCDPILGYAGTVDRVRFIGQQLSVMDIKTGPPAPWHALQLAAYAALVKEPLKAPLVRRWGLYLSADGTYRCVPYSDRRDWDVFKAALLVAQFKRTHA